MTIYLYKKTHNKTGLHYLGKTTKDPFKYKGSGKDWIPHISEHGYDVTTEILKECQSNKELAHWGRYYSALWNVKESPEWANRIPETGGGGGCSLFGDNHPMHRPEVAAKVGNALRGKKHSPERCAANAAGQKGKKCSEEAKKKKSDKLKGANHPNYIKTLYRFVHISGLSETNTIYNFYTSRGLPQGNVCRMVRGERKSVAGWKLDS
jgi:hypothetical protein